jgi:integrase/recombinase XerD
MHLVSCSRAREADDSVPTRSSISWPNTLRLRRRYVLRLPKKNVSPHVLRHAAAMELLQAGVDLSMISIWLGHESIETTQIYLDANLAIKNEILAKTHPVKSALHRYRPGDRLLNFLSSL